MTRKWWRTLLGVVLGVVAAVLLRNVVPEVTFPRGSVTALLLSIGFVIPDVVYNDVDIVLAATRPVFLPVIAATIVCTVVAGTDTVKRGVWLGILVGNVYVALHVGTIIFLATRGLTHYELSDLVLWIFVHPIAAVAAGILAGATMAYVLRVATTVRERASSSL